MVRFLLGLFLLVGAAVFTPLASAGVKLESLTINYEEGIVYQAIFYDIEYEDELYQEIASGISSESFTDTVGGQPS